MPRKLRPLAGAIAGIQALAERETKRRRGHVTPKRLHPRCGARTRTGRPCLARAVWDRVRDRSRSGRCRFHGGLSTGPKTPEGKARSFSNLRRLVEARR